MVFVLILLVTGSVVNVSFLYLYRYVQFLNDSNEQSDNHGLGIPVASINYSPGGTLRN